MTNFKHEDRYITIKRKDLDEAIANGLVSQHEKETLDEIVTGLRPRQYVVVESDWPEYGPVLRMIEMRVNGVNQGQPCGWLNPDHACNPLLGAIPLTREASAEHTMPVFVQPNSVKVLQLEDQLKQMFAGSIQRLADGAAKHFIHSGGKNFHTAVFTVTPDSHDQPAFEVTVTVQKQNAVTPAELGAKLECLLRRIRYAETLSVHLLKEIDDALGIKEG